MIELEREGGNADGVARIFLNRPQKVNALDSRMLDALATQIERLQEERSLRVVVLAGRGAEPEQELATGKIPFDDRQVARDILRRL